jgi:hypothetical protein
MKEPDPMASSNYIKEQGCSYYILDILDYNIIFNYKTITQYIQLNKVHSDNSRQIEQSTIPAIESILFPDFIPFTPNINPVMSSIIADPRIGADPRVSPPSPGPIRYPDCPFSPSRT